MSTQQTGKTSREIYRKKIRERNGEGFMKKTPGCRLDGPYFRKALGMNLGFLGAGKLSVLTRDGAFIRHMGAVAVIASGIQRVISNTSWK